MAFGDYWAQARLRTGHLGTVCRDSALRTSPRAELASRLQFCNPDGRCDDLKPLEEFLDLLSEFRSPGDDAQPRPATSALHQRSPAARQQTGQYSIDRLLWLEATIGDSGSGHSGRAAYKSCYMKQNFTRAEAKCIYKHLTRTIPGVDLRGSVMAVDSYGGAVNAKDLADVTSVWQRSSIMKVQFQQYWDHPDEDAGRLQWMREFYTDLYSQQVEPQYAGTPFPNEYYEGCYINYPDCDMLAYAFWPQLYYGTQDLYPFLQQVKRRYDPNNIFHHKMSIRA